jgi:hypothetical protein
MVERSFKWSTAFRTIGNLGSSGNRLRDQSRAWFKIHGSHVMHKMCADSMAQLVGMVERLGFYHLSVSLSTPRCD